MTEKKTMKPGKSRRKSRELVLKALYRQLLSTCDVRETMRDLADDGDYTQADAAYFQELLEGVIKERAALEARIAPLLDRKLEELSPIEHGILLIAGFELLFDVSIPYRVSINEGVELAKRYGGTDGYKFVNGVLDKLAATARPDEFEPVSRTRKVQKTVKE